MESAKFARGVTELIQAGQLPADYEVSADYQRHLTELAIQDGLIKPNENGAGFGARAKASFSSTPAGYENSLINTYGEGNVGKVGDRYVFKKDGEWGYVDPKGLDFGDVADMAGDALPVAGAVAGSMVGSRFGGKGAVAGTALGAGVGEYLKQLGGTALGIDNKQSGWEDAKDIGANAAFAAGGEVAGRGIGAAVGKMASPMAKYYGTAQQELEALAKKAGIKLSAADIMNKPALTRAENALGWGFTGQPITTMKQKQFEQLNKYLTKGVTARTGGANNTMVGESIQKSMGAGVKAARASFNDKYDLLMKSIGSDTISIDQTKALATQLLKESDDPILKNFMDNKITKQLQSIADFGKPVADPGLAPSLGSRLTGKAAPATETSTYPYERFKLLRTEVSNNGASNKLVGNVNEGKYKRIKGAMNEDFNTYVTKSGKGGEKAAIDAQYSKFKTDLERPEIKRVLGTGTKAPIDPENVVNTVITPTGTTRVAVAKKYGLTDKQAERGLINTLMDKSTSRAESLDYISPAKLQSNMKRYRTVANKVLSPEAKDTLGTYSTLGSRVSASNPANINPSGTGKVIEGAADIGAVVLNPALGWTLPASKYALSKAYASDLGTKYLTKGLMSEAARRKLAESLARTGAGAGPLIYNESKK